MIAIQYREADDEYLQACKDVMAATNNLRYRRATNSEQSGIDFSTSMLEIAKQGRRAAGKRMIYNPFMKVWIRLSVRFGLVG